MKNKVKKIVLAYSGGLDTSVILKWLQEEYKAEVVTFTADLGQREEIDPARIKAEKLGIKEIFIEDIKREFVRDYVFPMFRANTIYEGNYLLGTSIARPLIAKKLIEIAAKTGADAVAHGATGKGNDQVRFELGCYALNPDIKIIAPWREWNLDSRVKLIEYAKKHNIEVPEGKENEAPYSMDANLLHISYEGNALEDPWLEYEQKMLRLTQKFDSLPDKADEIVIEYFKGDPIAVNGVKLPPEEILERLNGVAGKHGIGVLDLVENRYVGIKSRGIYETPGGTLMLAAHRAIESITLDREAAHLKDELMPKYAKLIYNGYWFSPEREMLQAAIDKSQENVSGFVRLKLFKGQVYVAGRKSENSLYNANLASFDTDGGYNQKDAEGFIKLNALRFRIKKK
jgi:argininosuccinate synthase